MKILRRPPRQHVPTSPGLDRLERIANDAVKVSEQLQELVADIRRQDDTGEDEK